MKRGFLAFRPLKKKYEGKTENRRKLFCSRVESGTGAKNEGRKSSCLLREWGVGGGGEGRKDVLGRRVDFKRGERSGLQKEGGRGRRQSSREEKIVPRLRLTRMLGTVLPLGFFQPAQRPQPTPQVCRFTN